MRDRPPSHEARGRSSPSSVWPVLLAAFVGFGLAVRTPQVASLNAGLLGWLITSRPAGLEGVARTVSALTEPVVQVAFALVLAIAFWLRGSRYRSAVLGVSAAGALFVAVISKELFREPRPSLGHEIAGGFGFPSGHALLSACLAVVAIRLVMDSGSSAPLKAGIGASVLALALLIAYSRIYLGVHWPGDILGGWLAGSACALAVSTTIPRGK